MRNQILRTMEMQESRKLYKMPTQPLWELLILTIKYRCRTAGGRLKLAAVSLGNSKFKIIKAARIDSCNFWKKQVTEKWIQQTVHNFPKIHLQIPNLWTHGVLCQKPSRKWLLSGKKLRRDSCGLQVLRRQKLEFRACQREEANGNTSGFPFTIQKSCSL